MARRLYGHGQVKSSQVGPLSTLGLLPAAGGSFSEHVGVALTRLLMSQGLLTTITAKVPVFAAMVLRHT